VLAQWRSHPEQDFILRRSHLARSFVELGKIGRLVSHSGYSSRILGADIVQSSLDNWRQQDLPPQAQWEEILSPLRTPPQRSLASPTSDDDGLDPFGIIWLRTHYEDSDDAHAELVQDLNIDMGIAREQNILDDVARYSYGDDWSRIFEVIPERLFAITSDVSEALLNEAREYDARIQSLRNEMPARDTGENEFTMQLEKLHFWSTVNYMFVADKQALETGKVLVAFFDDRGRVVRTFRAAPYFAEELSGAWAEGEYNELDEFREAEIGVDYRPGGLCGPSFNL
jgi:hypothetical protein